MKDYDVIDIKGYNINGSNYYKLRDIGDYFDFGVQWDSGNNSIIVDTTKSY